MIAFLHGLSAAALLLGGAASATANPAASGSCANPAVTATVLSLVRDHSTTSPLMADPESRQAALRAFSDGTAPLSLHAVRTLGQDARFQRTSCAALLRITLPAATFDKMAGNLIAAASVGAAGWVRDPGASTASVNVQYAAQRTDDGRDVMVELAAARQVGAAAGLLAVAATVARREDGAPPSSAGRCADLELSSTHGLMLCANRHFQDADARLNAAYKLTMGRLPAARATALRDDQRAWLAKLRPECAAEQEAEGMGGTAATLNAVGCATKRTAERTQQIAAFQ